MNENPYGYNNPYGNNQGGYNALDYVNSQPYNPYYDSQRFFRRNSDKSNLKKLSLYGGGALLLYILIQNAIVLGMQLCGLMDIYYSNDLFQCAVDIIMSVVGMYLPFVFMGRKMQKISGEANPTPLNRPISGPLTFLAVVAGLGLCMIANYITSFITIFMSLFGIELSSPELAMPTGVLGVALTVVRIAVVAAIVEEMSLRGFVMGNLRRYGDTFAIIMSSFVFAFMHGNLIQAPFALIAGFGLGYFSVKTNSLWTGILIHLFNNLISVSVTYLFDVVPEETLNTVYGLLVYILIGAGIFAFIIFNKKTRNIPLRKNSTELSTGECVKYYLLSPTMIAAMIYMLFITITYISTYSAS
ncbi:MAG: CPBP family intramembrane metalloprotease [Clostridia bacterium]|nr:CPBP family intramembrane metalloprotease [Clostridia bacterium]